MATITPATGIAVMIPIRMKLSGILDTVSLPADSVITWHTCSSEFYDSRDSQGKTFLNCPVMEHLVPRPDDKPPAH